MSAQPESSSRLTGLEEASLYHDCGEYGFFSLLWHENAPVASKLPRTASQGCLKVQRSYPLRVMPQIVENLDPNRDTWISQAEFIRQSRRVVYLLRLNLCFVDLDTYKTPWKSYSPEAMSNLIRGFCQDEDIPDPSLILFSGRGLQVKWIFKRPIPRATLPRWNAVQRQLVERLKRFGADPGAKDASRLLRLVDTVNTRSGERVRVLWVNESQGEIIHYGFDFFSGWLLPVDRDVIRKGREDREERRQALQLLEGGRTGNLRPSSNRQLAWDRLEDLRTLAKLRAWTEKGIPHGYRSKYIHWTLNFLLLSGAVHSSQLFYEAQALVREVCPALPQDTRTVLSTLYRKAQAYEAGERVEFGGRIYPPLYTPRNSTLMELFAITDAEAGKLKTIISKEEAVRRHRERARLRDRQRRRESGAVDRATYLETAEQRRAQARLLRARGLTWAEVGREMGISFTAAYKLANR